MCVKRKSVKEGIKRDGERKERWKDVERRKRARGGGGEEGRRKDTWGIHREVEEWWEGRLMRRKVGKVREAGHM